MRSHKPKSARTGQRTRAAINSDFDVLDTSEWNRIFEPGRVTRSQARRAQSLLEAMPGHTGMSVEQTTRTKPQEINQQITGPPQPQKVQEVHPIPTIDSIRSRRNQNQEDDQSQQNHQTEQPQESMQSFQGQMPQSHLVQIPCYQSDETQQLGLEPDSDYQENQIVQQSSQDFQNNIHLSSEHDQNQYENHAPQTSQCNLSNNNQSVQQSYSQNSNIAVNVHQDTAPQNTTAYYEPQQNLISIQSYQTSEVPQENHQRVQSSYQNELTQQNYNGQHSSYQNESTHQNQGQCESYQINEVAQDILQSTPQQIHQSFYSNNLIDTSNHSYSSNEVAQQNQQSYPTSYPQNDLSLQTSQGNPSSYARNGTAHTRQQIYTSSYPKNEEVKQYYQGDPPSYPKNDAQNQIVPSHQPNNEMAPPNYRGNPPSYPNNQVNQTQQASGYPDLTHRKQQGQATNYKVNDATNRNLVSIATYQNSEVAQQHKWTKYNGNQALQQNQNRTSNYQSNRSAQPDAPMQDFPHPPSQQFPSTSDRRNEMQQLHQGVMQTGILSQVLQQNHESQTGFPANYGTQNNCAQIQTFGGYEASPQIGNQFPNHQVLQQNDEPQTGIPANYGTQTNSGQIQTYRRYKAPQQTSHQAPTHQVLQRNHELQTGYPENYGNQRSSGQIQTQRGHKAPPQTSHQAPTHQVLQQNHELQTGYPENYGTQNNYAQIQAQRGYKAPPQTSHQAPTHQVLQQNHELQTGFPANYGNQRNSGQIQTQRGHKAPPQTSHQAPTHQVLQQNHELQTGFPENYGNQRSSGQIQVPTHQGYGMPPQHGKANQRRQNPPPKYQQNGRFKQTVSNIQQIPNAVSNLQPTPTTVSTFQQRQSGSSLQNEDWNFTLSSNVDEEGHDEFNAEYMWDMDKYLVEKRKDHDKKQLELKHTVNNHLVLLRCVNEQRSAGNSMVLAQPNRIFHQQQSGQGGSVPQLPPAPSHNQQMAVNSMRRRPAQLQQYGNQQSNDAESAQGRKRANRNLIQITDGREVANQNFSRAPKRPAPSSYPPPKRCVQQHYQNLQGNSIVNTYGYVAEQSRQMPPPPYPSEGVNWNANQQYTQWTGGLARPLYGCFSPGQVQGARANEYHQISSTNAGYMGGTVTSQSSSIVQIQPNQVDLTQHRQLYPTQPPPAYPRPQTAIRTVVEWTPELVNSFTRITKACPLQPNQIEHIQELLWNNRNGAELIMRYLLCIIIGDEGPIDTLTLAPHFTKMTRLVEMCVYPNSSDTMSLTLEQRAEILLPHGTFRYLYQYNARRREGFTEWSGYEHIEFPLNMNTRDLPYSIPNLHRDYDPNLRNEHWALKTYGRSRPTNSAPPQRQQAIEGPPNQQNFTEYGDDGSINHFQTVRRSPRFQNNRPPANGCTSITQPSTSAQPPVTNPPNRANSSGREEKPYLNPTRNRNLTYITPKPAEHTINLTLGDEINFDSSIRNSLSDLGRGMSDDAAVESFFSEFDPTIVMTEDEQDMIITLKSGWNGNASE